MMGEFSFLGEASHYIYGLKIQRLIEEQACQNRTKNFTCLWPPCVALYVSM